MSDVGKAKVLVLGVNYAPEEVGIAPYTTGMCEELARLGATVTIITGHPYLPDWKFPEGWEPPRPEMLNGVRILRVPQYIPARQSAVHRARMELSFMARAIFRAKDLHQPDLILGVTPHLAGAAAAVVLGRRWSRPVGVVVQDLMGSGAAQSGIAGGGRVAGLTNWLEGGVLRTANHVGIVAEGFRRPLVEMGVEPHRIHHLPNWTHLASPSQPRAGIRRELGWKNGECVVLHAGNMGLKQGLENVVEAARLAAARNLPVRFILMGGGNQRERLAQLGRGLPNLEFRSPEPKNRLPDVLAAADVLLVNERGSAVNMSLPSKLTSYFVAGRPVLGAVPTEGTTATEISRSGGGRVVAPEDPEALLEEISRLGRDLDLSRDLGAAGRLYAEAELGAEQAMVRYHSFFETLGFPQQNASEPVPA